MSDRDSLAVDLAAIIELQRQRDEAKRECDQLRAERDAALTLLRQVRPLLDEALDKQEGASPYLDGGRIAVRDAAEAARLIDASHLLDDEGQQQ